MKLKQLFPIIFLALGSLFVSPGSIMANTLINSLTLTRFSADLMEKDILESKVVSNLQPSITSSMPSVICENELVEFETTIRPNGGLNRNVLLRTTFTGNDVKGNVELWYQSKSNGTWKLIDNPGDQPYEYGPFKLVEETAIFRIKVNQPMNLSGSIQLVDATTNSIIQEVQREIKINPAPSVSTNLPTSLYKDELVEFDAIIRANGNERDVLLRTTFTGNDVNGNVDLWYKSKSNGSWNLIDNPGNNPYEYGPFKLVDDNAQFRIKVKQPMSLSGSIQLVDGATNSIIQEVQREIKINPAPIVVTNLPVSMYKEELVEFDAIIRANGNERDVLLRTSFTGNDVNGNVDLWYKSKSNGTWNLIDNPGDKPYEYGPFKLMDDNAQFRIKVKQSMNLEGSIQLVDATTNSIIQEVQREIKINPAPIVVTNLPVSMYKDELVEFDAIIRANGNERDVLLRTTFTGNDVNGNVDLWYKSKSNGTWNLIDNPGDKPYEYGPFKLMDDNAQFRIKVKQSMNLEGSIQLVDATTNSVIQEVQRDVIINPAPTVSTNLPTSLYKDELVEFEANIRANGNIRDVLLRSTFTGNEINGYVELWYQSKSTGSWILVENPGSNPYVFGPFNLMDDKAKFRIKVKQPMDLAGSIQLVDATTNSIIQEVQREIKINPAPTVSTNLPTTFYKDELIQFDANIRANGNDRDVLLRSTFTGNEVNSNVELWYQSKSTGSWTLVDNPGSNPYVYGPFKLVDDKVKFRIKVKQPMNLAGSIQLVDAATNTIIQEVKKDIVVMQSPTISISLPDEAYFGELINYVGYIHNNGYQGRSVRVESSLNGDDLSGKIEAWRRDKTDGKWLPIPNPADQPYGFGPFVLSDEYAEFRIKVLKTGTITVNIKLIDDETNNVMATFSKTIIINPLPSVSGNLPKNLYKGELVEFYANIGANGNDNRDVLLRAEFAGNQIDNNLEVWFQRKSDKSWQPLLNLESNYYEYGPFQLAEDTTKFRIKAKQITMFSCNLKLIDAPSQTVIEQIKQDVIVNPTPELSATYPIASCVNELTEFSVQLKANGNTDRMVRLETYLSSTDAEENIEVWYKTSANAEWTPLSKLTLSSFRYGPFKLADDKVQFRVKYLKEGEISSTVNLIDDNNNVLIATQSKNFTVYQAPVITDVNADNAVIGEEINFTVHMDSKNNPDRNVIFRTEFSGDLKKDDLQFYVWYDQGGYWYEIPFTNTYLFELGPFGLTTADLKFKFRAQNKIKFKERFSILDANTGAILADFAEDEEFHVHLQPIVKLQVPENPVINVENIIPTELNAQGNEHMRPVFIRGTITGDDSHINDHVSAWYRVVTPASNVSGKKAPIDSPWIEVKNVGTGSDLWGPLLLEDRKFEIKIKSLEESELIIKAEIVDAVDQQVLSVSEMPLKIGLATSIEDELNKRVSVYPNPCSNQLNINPEQDGLDVLEVWSVAGKLVYREEGLKTKNITLKVANWENGFYMIKAIGKEKTEVFRFIKE